MVIFVCVYALEEIVLILAYRKWFGLTLRM